MERAILIGVIFTYADLTSMCRQLGNTQEYKLMVHEGALASALPGLRHFEKKGVEVIVTTRGNNLFVKDHTKIPVIATEQVNLSKESFISALETAKELAMVRRQERRKSFRLQAILDWAHEGIVATDENGVITLFNKAAEKIFGLRNYCG